MADQEEAVRKAVAIARRTLAIKADQPARTWEVLRLNAEKPRYLLMVFGPPGGVTGIAAIDPASGEVLESARLPGSHAHTLMSADEAARRAGVNPVTDTQLVWEPTPASRSPFYPLWQIRQGPNVLWVDAVRGDVHRTLRQDDGKHRGGGAVA